MSDDIPPRNPPQRRYCTTYASLPGELVPPADGGPWKLVPNGMQSFALRPPHEGEPGYTSGTNAYITPSAAVLLWEEDRPTAVAEPPTTSISAAKLYLRALQASLHSVLLPAILCTSSEPVTYDAYRGDHAALLASLNEAISVPMNFIVEGSEGVELTNTLSCVHRLVPGAVSSFNAVLAYVAARGGAIHPYCAATALCASIMEVVWRLSGDKLDVGEFFGDDIRDNPYYDPELLRFDAVTTAPTLNLPRTDA